MDAIPPTSAATRSPAAAKPALTSDFNTFLRMLTTQMQNQDPLNPIESADYAVQLATFSGVEQQVKANTLLSQMSAQFNLLGMAQLSGWVGQEAQSSAPVHFDRTPVTLTLPSVPGADRAVLVIRDAAGNLVAREDVPPAGGPYQWLGADPSGSPLPQGLYDLTLEGEQDGTVIATAPVSHYARIEEARRSDGNLMLILRGGVQVPADRITALRMP
ncbi:flagellar hook assembly protein FlgD [Rhodobacteraceae bacterium HSP-20]|uniref:Basal-body rod modification protein FlgD n=1 Tax=Paragemmobacter amnigenus TaxID=2852097 RepID=A0ABS6J2K2_9RHOB|nr:flagellar hook capping FlgD N-terminal domain-containing protein [Rhodobacter amnigenus]MBU9697833.1 flagellar hook assembly protein FlgD [Rhodobacter amnigenus]MBV4389060.1 flagellar hook assembly protein FlgD [Rhodobacter amnigenus]